MSESSPAIAGVQFCGCITLVDTEVESLDRHTEKALSEIIRSGGWVRRMTVGELRTDPNFLPSKCPHDPQGWEKHRPEAFKPTARCKTTYRGTVKRVCVRPTEWHKHTWSGGDIDGREGAWWGTEAWLDPTGIGAHSGDDSAEVIGPFKTRRECLAVLTDLAVKRYEEFCVEIDRQRREKAAA